MSDSFSFSGDIWLIPMRKPDLYFFFFFLIKLAVPFCV